MTKPKLIVPKHVWDGAQAEKTKNELEKVPKPVGWRIVLFPLKLQGKTKGGILLTDAVKDDISYLTTVGRVLKLGDLAYKDVDKFPNGQWCNVDDYVCYGKHAGQKLFYKGIKLLLLFDDQVIMTVEEPTHLDPTFNLTKM